MLQQDEPEDFVIATGEQHSVRDFVDAACAELGMPVRWRGSGVEEKGHDAAGKCIVAVDTALLPAYRGGNPAGRRDEGEAEARLAPEDHVPRAGGGNGERGSQGGASATSSCRRHGYTSRRTTTTSERRWMRRTDADLTSPATAASSARRSCASCARAGYRNIVCARTRELDLTDRGRGAGFLRTRAARVRFHGRGQGRRHPREQHLPRRIHPGKPRDPDQRASTRPGAAAWSACCSSARPASIRATARSR